MFDSAIKHNKIAIELDPYYTSPLFNLAIIEKDLNMFDAAREHFHKVIQLDSNDENAYFYLAYVEKQL